MINSKTLSYLFLIIISVATKNGLAFTEATRDGNENVKINPEITIDDNTIKPSITFSTNGEAFNNKNLKWLFEFRANSGIDVGNFEDPIESAEEIISEFVADGGNIEFDLSLMWRSQNRSDNSRGFAASIGPYYSLLTTDALSTDINDSSVISVDAEVYGIKTEMSYKFKQITAFARAANYKTSDDGVNLDFTRILDDGTSLAWGVDLPLSALTEDGDSNSDGYVLRFERTKHTEVDKAIFRVSITRAFDFLK